MFLVGVVEYDIMLVQGPLLRTVTSAINGWKLNSDVRLEVLLICAFPVAVVATA